MAPFFQRQLFMGTPRRPLLRIVVVCLVFGIFFVIFFPPTDTPHLEHRPFFPVHHRPVPMRPISFAPPDPGSHRHRIKPQQRLPTEFAGHQIDDVWAQRADAVRGAFLHAYSSYVTYAAPHDELLPLAKAPIDKCVRPFCVLACAFAVPPDEGRHTASTAGVSRL
jgi:hypothetical protein